MRQVQTINEEVRVEVIKLDLKIPAFERFKKEARAKGFVNSEAELFAWFLDTVRLMDVSAQQAYLK